MGLYSNKAMFTGYNKANKEREKDDYYSTPTEEVTNILNELGWDLDKKIILEPCLGGGHMIKGIDNYLKEKSQTPFLKLGTDLRNRGFSDDTWQIQYGEKSDFLSTDYPIKEADIVIMNPPYSILEPFLLHGLSIAKEKMVALCRMGATEGVNRYEKIFSKYPPTDIYQYVDRIHCNKNGTPQKAASAQGYCWLVWDFNDIPDYPRYHWLRRADKK